MNNLFVRREAKFSDDRRYRYWLKIVWDESLPCLGSIGLNPSDADEFDNDNTIRREIGFAQVLKCGALLKTNIYSYVTPYPKELDEATDPIGGIKGWFNSIAEYLVKNNCKPILAGWGAHAGERGIEAKAHFAAMGLKLDCLGLNKDGSPVHPLYQPYSATLIPFNYEVRG
jgi:hypothetical protein